MYTLPTFQLWMWCKNGKMQMHFYCIHYCITEHYCNMLFPFELIMYFWIELALADLHDLEKEEVGVETNGWTKFNASYLLRKHQGTMFYMKKQQGSGVF